MLDVVRDLAGVVKGVHHVDRLAGRELVGVSHVVAAALQRGRGAALLQLKAAAAEHGGHAAEHRDPEGLGRHAPYYTAGMASDLDRFIAEAPHTRSEIAGRVRAFAASLPSGAELLDAGAGDAPYRALFAHCVYRTHDWPGSPHVGAAAADVVADIAALPVADASFDAVLCTEVLEHVRGPHRAAAELRRVLRPGGRILVTVPFVGELHEEPYDFQRFTSHGLRALLEDAGFSQVEVEPLGGLGTTLAQLLRNAGMATGRNAGPWSVGRALAWGSLVASVPVGRLRQRLDRADQRRALPVGWVAEARA